MRLTPPPPPALARWIGVTLMVTGVLGLLISLSGLIFVAIAGAAAEEALIRKLDTFDKALVATSDGLAIADSALAETRSTLIALGTALDNATTAISETQPMIARLHDLTGEDLPETIGSTRQALTSAQATAQIVDRVLSAAAIFGVPYNPEVPLGVAIGQVSDSLADLPADLEEVSIGLGTASDNIGQVASDMEKVSAGVTAIARSAGEATMVVNEYQVVVRDLRGEIAAIREEAPLWITLVRLGLTLLLVWLGLAQVGLLSQGWEMLGRGAKGVEAGRHEGHIG